MNRMMRFGKSASGWTRRGLALSLLALIALQSCKKEVFELDRVKDATWNPEIAVPLINSTVTVPEVLNRFDDDDVIVVDSTGILALKYFGEIFSITADSVLILQNQTNTQGYALTSNDVIVLSGGSPIVLPPVSYDVPLDLSNMNPQPEIHQIDFKGGTLVLQVTSQHSYQTSVNISIPGLTNSAGQPFSQNITGVTNSNSQTINVALAGMSLDLTLGSQGFNDIRVVASTTISPGGVGIPGDRVDLTLNVNNIEFSTILGDVKTQTFGTPADEVRIRFFENQQDGDIFWYDPRVKAIFTNGLGAEVQLNVNQLDFAAPSGTFPLTGPLSGITNIAFNPTVGGTAVTTVDINRSNSNIVTVAAAEPKKLFYQVDAITNPNGAPAGLNWFKDTSRVKLDMEVFLPFDGRAVGFSKADTTEVQIFPLDGDVKEIESVTFRLTIDNGFPADAKAQVYFFDSTLVDTNFIGTPVPIDSLFDDVRAVVFASPTPDASGRVDQSNKRRTVLDITIDRAKLEKLEARNFSQLVAKGWIDTYNLGQDEVRVYGDYAMDLYLGVMVKFKANISF